VPTVYLCSRKDGESGYPRGTPGIEVFLGTMTDERSAMHGWAAVFMAIFKDISEVNEFGLDFFQDQINLNVDVAPSIESIVQTALGILNKRKPEALFSIQYYEEEKFLGLVAEVIRPQFLKFQKSLESYMDRNNLIPNEIFDVAGHPLYLLVVFDEARSLLTDSSEPLLAFRRFMRIFASLNVVLDSGVFGIVTDTMSRVSNFVPTPFSDPSSRVADFRTRLMHPVIEMLSMNIHGKDKPFPTSWRSMRNRRKCSDLVVIYGIRCFWILYKGRYYLGI